MEAAEAAVGGHLDHRLPGRLRLVGDLGGHHRVVLGDQLAVAPDGVGVALVEPVLLAGPELGREQAQAPVGPVQVPGPAVGQLVVERLEPVLLGHPDVLPSPPAMTSASTLGLGIAAQDSGGGG
jgi:hypothetical protein